MSKYDDFKQLTMVKCCPNCNKFFESDRYAYCSSKCRNQHALEGFDRLGWLRYWLSEQTKQRAPYLNYQLSDDDLSHEFYRLMQRD